MKLRELVKSTLFLLCMHQGNATSGSKVFICILLNPVTVSNLPVETHCKKKRFSLPAIIKQRQYITLTLYKLFGGRTK